MGDDRCVLRRVCVCVLLKKALLLQFAGDDCVLACVCVCVRASVFRCPSWEIGCNAYAPE